MDAPRLINAELLVDTVEFAEELDDLAIGIAMIGRDVVTDAVSDWAPDQGNPVHG